MHEDVLSAGWPRKAASRWFLYLALWSLTVVLCATSALHVVLFVVGALSGCLLAASLPLMSSTLFELAHSRRAHADMPPICCPWIGAVIVLAGSGALLRCSAILVSEVSNASFDSAREMCERFAGMPSSSLPHAVCIKNAFVKTEWEAGKLECESQLGRVSCESAFEAAPIFNSKALADIGKPEEIWAWAVTRGAHVDASYRSDGTYCGYLVGMPELDFYGGDFRLAVHRVVEKHQLQSSAGFAGAHRESGAVVDDMSDLGGSAPLEGRPMVLSVDPMTVRYEMMALLVAAVIFLCCCPCVGPVPLGFILLFCSCATMDPHSGRHRIALEDSDGEFHGAF